MSDNRWRLVIDGPRTGAENMARDEALARCHQPDGALILRTYRFSPPAVTIGRFQKWPGTMDLEGCGFGDADVIRRPTGGLAILHSNDFTYSVVTGAGSPGYGDRDRVFNMVATAIVTALGELGVEAAPVSHRGKGTSRDDWCFGSMFGVDLEWNGRKICGSAQRLIRSSVLQHGSLFLRPDDESTLALYDSPDEGRPVSPLVTLDEAAGSPVGWEEVLGAFRIGFERVLGVAPDQGTLGDLEENMARKLLETKYSRPEWLLRQPRPGHVRAL